MQLDRETRVGVVGAGAMGTGIAQVAAAAGHEVVLGDAVEGATQRAQANIAKSMDREVQKGRLSRDAADELLSRIAFQWEPLRELGAYRKCGLVIEAVVEDLTVKRSLFRELEQAVGREPILAGTSTDIPANSASVWSHP